MVYRHWFWTKRVGCTGPKKTLCCLSLSCALSKSHVLRPAYSLLQSCQTAEISVFCITTYVSRMKQETSRLFLLPPDKYAICLPLIENNVVSFWIKQSMHFWISKTRFQVSLAICSWFLGFLILHFWSISKIKSSNIVIQIWFRNFL